MKRGEKAVTRPPLSEGKESLRQVVHPNLPEAHVSQARLYEADYRFAEAEEEYKRAIALTPSNATAHHRYSWCLLQLGRAREALSEVLRAEELDPLSLFIIIRVCICGQYGGVGDEEEVLKRLQKLREIDPESPITLTAFANYYLHKPDYDQALTSLNKSKQLWPNRQVSDVDSDLADIAYIYAVTNRRDQATEILNRLQNDFNQGAPVASGIAEVYNGLGDLDECFKWLEKAFNAHEPDILWWWRFSPLAEKVRKDPRFNDLLRRANLPLVPVN